MLTPIATAIILKIQLSVSLGRPGKILIIDPDIKPSTIRKAKLRCFSKTLLVILENSTIPTRKARTTVPTVITLVNHSGVNQLSKERILVARWRRGS